MNTCQSLGARSLQGPVLPPRRAIPDPGPLSPLILTQAQGRQGRRKGERRAPPALLPRQAFPLQRGPCTTWQFIHSLASSQAPLETRGIFSGSHSHLTLTSEDGLTYRSPTPGPAPPRSPAPSLTSYFSLRSPPSEVNPSSPALGSLPSEPWRDLAPALTASLSSNLSLPLQPTRIS